MTSQASSVISKDLWFCKGQVAEVAPNAQANCDVDFSLSLALYTWLHDLLVVIPRLHDTTGCQDGLTTVLNEQTVRSTGCQTGFTICTTRFDNRLYRVNGALQTTFSPIVCMSHNLCQDYLLRMA